MDTADTDQSSATAAEPSQHIAFRAWQRLNPASDRAPSLVQRLNKHKGHESAVYRLDGIGDGQSPVIAKRSPLRCASVERSVYEEILPKLTLSHPPYYGSISDEDEDHLWLFLGDAGQDGFSWKNPAHRDLAARWIGDLHSSASALVESADLPERGTGHYLHQIEEAQKMILNNETNPSFSREDLQILDLLLEDLAFLGDRWGRLEEICAPLPRTLIHGDFVAKNLRVQTAGSTCVLHPFDWETAGWGVAGPDLVRFTTEPPASDLHTYLSIAGKTWPRLDLGDLDSMIQAGKIFRFAAAVNWECENLPFEWAPYSIRNLETHRARLHAAAKAVGLRK